MSAPRHLVDWPWVVVEVECSLCPRRGRYRLARLAERYGSAVPLGRLLETMAADCTLMKPDQKPRQYEARCGIRYVVPPAGPLPADAPARAGAPRLDPPKPANRKRLGYDGPAPTIAQLRQQGISALFVTCHGLRQGVTCHHTTRLSLDPLEAPDDMSFLELCRSLRLVCSLCGGRKMHIVPLWPDVRQARAASFGIDSKPRMPGTVVPYRMPGT
ncbi:hypothetical protein D3273_19800 [Lichenibacterium minor]|uniref:Uncharacterized protein n=1 Tax=Lichenibacterium minor TaxID=2316528 RepID=A0A4Q2U264_9HYPH|nr:hypothetical protein [Lichenibacterium minor]RYC30220.1 hypothetical protein D3273_19800 [Lichenibacterium minor]